jgi:hypothetical protein
MGFVPEHPQFADFVLLQNKRHGGLPKDLLKVETRKVSSSSTADPASQTADGFDVITAGAFDMVSVDGGNTITEEAKEHRDGGHKKKKNQKVPKYITVNREGTETSEQAWVVIESAAAVCNKPAQKVH